MKPDLCNCVQTKIIEFIAPPQQPHMGQKCFGTPCIHLILPELVVVISGCLKEICSFVVPLPIVVTGVFVVSFVSGGGGGITMVVDFIFSVVVCAVDIFAVVRLVVFSAVISVVDFVEGTAVGGV